MFDNLLERLKKPFTNIKLDTTTSVTSSIDNVDMYLGDINLQHPEHHNIRGNFERKQHKENIEVLEDTLIRTYKQISVYPEISSAIDEIINECLSLTDEGVLAPSITFKQDTDISKQTQEKIADEWNYVLNLLDFEYNGDELFRKWYEESKLVAEIVYKDKNTNQGIQNVLILNPMGFRKRIDKDGKPFYIYENQGKTRVFNYGQDKDKDNEYDIDQIVVTDSGMKKEDGTKIGFMYPAIKTVNNMNQIEDSLIIYRQLRASEQRIWNLNVGRMPKSKAENYINSVINQIKTDMVYNHETGEMTGKSATDSIINDFVFPSRGNESTSVDTIGGQTNFVDTLEDHELFLKKTYVALKIPVTRLDVDGNTLDYTGTDIIKIEEKFHKHTRKILKRFSNFPLDILRLQLISKKLITEAEWKDIKNAIVVKWNSNNAIIENGKLENLKLRSETLVDLKDNGVAGKILSYTTIMTKVMNLTPEEYKEEQKLIKKEQKDFPELYKSDEEDM